VQRAKAVRAADEAAVARLHAQMEADEVRIVGNFGKGLAQTVDNIVTGHIRVEDHHWVLESLGLF
jgi:hypothetical protein